MKFEHHTRLTPPLLKTLTGAGDTRLVSLLMPTHRAGQGMRQDPIRLKNLIDKTRRDLRELGEDEHSIDARLGPLDGIVGEANETHAFWQRQSDGLAIFVDDEHVRTFRLPTSFEETSVVGPYFHLKPLLSTPVSDRKFYVLIASKDELHLLACTRSEWKHLTFDELPEGREAIMKFVDEERQLQFHSTSAGRGPGNGQAAVFHGHGATEQHEKDRILEYFQAVNRALHRMMIDYRTPVVFAGVDYLFPIFRKAVHEVNLLDEHIPGNHDENKGDFDRVHSQAVEMIERREARDVDLVLDAYGNASGASQTSHSIEEVVLASDDGRVAALLLDGSSQIPGRFDRRSRLVQVAEEPSMEDTDLINLAAVLTARHGGEIMTIEPERMPDQQPVAAMLRY